MRTTGCTKESSVTPGGGRVLLNEFVKSINGRRILDCLLRGKTKPCQRLQGSNRRDPSTADCSEGCENIALQRVKPDELSVVGFACSITTEQEHDERKRISQARASCRRRSRAFGRPRSPGGAVAASAAMHGSCNRSRAVGTPERKFGAAQARPADQTSGTVTAPFFLRWLPRFGHERAETVGLHLSLFTLLLGRTSHVCLLLSRFAARAQAKSRMPAGGGDHRLNSHHQAS